VQATCCLHNFIINHEDNNRYYSTATLNDEPNEAFQGNATERHSYCKSAAIIRDTFANYFEGDGAVTWQWDKALRNEF